jgi:hypothetical protein
MKLGVFHAGALGDCVLALHVARAAALSRHLAKGGSAAEGGVVSRSAVARLAVGRSFVRSAWDLDSAGMSTLFAVGGGADAIDPAVSRIIHEFDAVISFCGRADEPPATRLRELASGPVWAIDPRPRPETVAAGRHITQQWIDDLREAGLDVPSVTSDVLIRLEEADREYGRRFWDQPGVRSAEGFRACHAPRPPLIKGGSGRPWPINGRSVRRVLLHPGSGGKAKCWPLDRFEALARGLREGNRQVAWIIGPVEVDWYGEGFRRRLAGTAPVAYEEDIRGAASVIAGADVFVGNDAGMTHLAAGLGVSIVAIYGPTSPEVWRPLGPGVRVVCGGKGGEPFPDVGVSDVLCAVAEAYAGP